MYDDVDRTHNDPDRIAAPDVGAAMSLAESYPTVPLRTVFAEFQHADRTVPSSTANRDYIIAQVVEARLARLSVRGIDESAVTP